MSQYAHNMQSILNHRKLASDATSSVKLTTFAFSFTQSGTYVFRMSSNPSVLMIISVQPKNVACTTGSPFVEFTSTNLINVGVTSNSDIVLTPDWSLVIGLLVGKRDVFFPLLFPFLYYYSVVPWVLLVSYTVLSLAT